MRTGTHVNCYWHWKMNREFKIKIKLIFTLMFELKLVVPQCDANGLQRCEIAATIECSCCSDKTFISLWEPLWFNLGLRWVCNWLRDYPLNGAPQKLNNRFSIVVCLLQLFAVIYTYWKSKHLSLFPYKPLQDTKVRFSCLSPVPSSYLYCYAPV